MVILSTQMGEHIMSASTLRTKERFDELINGIKFTGMLSVGVIQQLVKKTP
jgi:hypothetical protein